MSIQRAWMTDQVAWEIAKAARQTVRQKANELVNCKKAIPTLQLDRLTDVIYLMVRTDLDS